MSRSHSCPHPCVACETASAATGNERRLRMMVRGTALALNGKRSVSFGLRLGYWPCMRGPFITVSFFIWHLDVWYGLSSYKANP